MIGLVRAVGHVDGAAVREPHLAERVVGGDERQWADRRVDHGVPDVGHAATPRRTAGWAPADQRWCSAYDRHGRH